MPQNLRLVATGPKLIDGMLFETLKTIWRYNVTTKSEFAREHADYVAMAASMGFVSTRITEDVYGRQWQITSRGLMALEDNFGLRDDEDEQEEVE